MLCKSFIASIFLLASISSANAHAGVTPALGVKGQFTRDDVQFPSTSSPCGNVNIAKTLGNSTPVPVGKNGEFSANITDFNGGGDGSRSIKAVQVDASGTGKNFVPAKMVVNGNPNPTAPATELLTVQLPAGIKCAGGAGKNLCLASFTTTAGFGNCVVISQGAGNDDKKKGDDVKKNVGDVKKNVGDVKKNVGDVKKNADDGKKDADDDKKDADDDKKDADDDKKDANDDKKDADDDKKNADDDKKKGDERLGNVKQANKCAPDTPAATDVNKHKRSWSSRQMGNFA